MKYDLFAMARTAGKRGEIKFAPLPKDVQAEVDEWTRSNGLKCLPIENTEEEMKALEASEKAADGVLLKGAAIGSKWKRRDGVMATLLGFHPDIDRICPYRLVAEGTDENRANWNAENGTWNPNARMPQASDIIGPWTE